MRLKVRHQTRYDYQQPVAYSIQLLYLTPPVLGLFAPNHSPMLLPILMDH